MSGLEELEGGLQAVEEVLKNEFRDVLVDFWSPWCAPCRALRPHLDKLSHTVSTRCRFVAVNTIAHPDAAEKFGVSSLPTLILFRKENEIHRFSDGVLVSSVEDKLRELAEA